MTWNGVAWSISAEMAMYLLFACAVLALPVRPKLVFSCLSGIALGLLIAFELGAPLSRFVDFCRCICGFSLGVLIFGAVRDRGCRLETRLGLAGATALELCSVVLAVTFLWFAAAPFTLPVAAFAFAPLIFVFALEAGWLAQFLNRKAFIALGTLSYSIYMIHPFLQSRILTPVALVAQKLSGITIFDHRLIEGVNTRVWGLSTWQGNLATVIMVAALIAMARLTYAWIEEPGRSYVRRRTVGAASSAELKLPRLTDSQHLPGRARPRTD